MLAWGLQPWLEDRGFFLIFIPATLFAAGFGGVGPGLLATALSVAIALLVGGGNLSQPALLEALIFAIVGGGISWFGEQLRRSRIRDATHTQDLRAREAHLRSILNTALLPKAAMSASKSMSAKCQTRPHRVRYPQKPTFVSVLSMSAKCQ